jgi:hypothetical protein
MTSEQWSAHERVVEEVLTSYRDFADFDDLAQTVRLNTYRSIEREQQTEWRGGLVALIAKRCIAEFFRSPENRFRRVTKRGNPVPSVLSLSYLAQEDQSWVHPVEPDFVPRLIDRLTAQECWAAMARQSTPEEMEMLARYLHGENGAELGREKGKFGSAILLRLQRVLNRARVTYGISTRSVTHKALVPPMEPARLLLSPEDEGLRTLYPWRQTKWGDVYAPKPDTGKRGNRYWLQQVVWERMSGPIPAGWHVRRANKDSLDYRRENLILLTTGQVKRRNRNPARLIEARQREQSGWRSTWEYKDRRNARRRARSAEKKR